MPSVTPLPPLQHATGDVRMTLLKTEYLEEHGGRLPAGTVVLVDEATARRWRRRGIAVDSAETDKTLLEQKQAQLAALRAEIEQIEGGHYGVPEPEALSPSPGRMRSRRTDE